MRFFSLIVVVYFLQSCSTQEPRKEIRIDIPHSQELSLDSDYEFKKQISIEYNLYGIKLHPKKDILFAYGESNKVTLYDANTLNPLKQLKSENSSINTLTISKDGKYLALAGDTGGFFSSKAYIEIWDLNSYTKLHSIESNNNVHALAFSSDNKKLASGGKGKKINIWDLQTAKKIRQFKSQSDYGLDDNIIHLDFIQNNSILISITKEKKLEKWKMHSSSNVPKYSNIFQLGDGGKINKVKITDKYIVLALRKVKRIRGSLPQWSHYIKFYNHRGESHKTFSKHKRLISSFDIGKNSERMVSTSEDKTIQIYDLEKNEDRIEIKLDRQGKDICLNNHLIIVLDGNHKIKTWEIKDSFSPKVSNTKNLINSNRYALVVALDYYENSSIPILENAVSDAREATKILREKGFNVLPLYNNNANKANIIKAIKKIKEVSIDKNSILFYFSGHGEGVTLKNGVREGYIIPYDFKSSIYVPKKLDALYYDEHAISIASLVKNTMDTKSERIALLFDSCFSGLAINAYPSAKSVNILTAGTDKKVSDGIGHSPFAKALTKKLAISSPECLSFSSLSNYVSDEVKSKTKNEQIPQFKVNNEKQFCF